MVAVPLPPSKSNAPHGAVPVSAASVQAMITGPVLPTILEDPQVWAAEESGLRQVRSSEPLPATMVRLVQGWDPLQKIVQSPVPQEMVPLQAEGEEQVKVHRFPRLQSAEVSV